MKRTPYRHHSLAYLSQNLKSVRLYIKAPRGAMSSGTTSAFWVGGDGFRTAVYTCTGNLEILNNQDFDFIGVKGSDTKTTDGRVTYKSGNDWLDLGPISPSGVVPSDPSMDTIVSSHVVAKPVDWHKELVKSTNELRLNDPAFED